MDDSRRQSNLHNISYATVKFTRQNCRYSALPLSKHGLFCELCNLHILQCLFAQKLFLFFSISLIFILWGARTFMECGQIGKYQRRKSALLYYLPWQFSKHSFITLQKLAEIFSVLVMLNEDLEASKFVANHKPSATNDKRDVLFF